MSKLILAYVVRINAVIKSNQLSELILAYVVLNQKCRDILVSDAACSVGV